MRARLAAGALCLLAVACTERSRSAAPLLVQVRQAQTLPSFTHVLLKVFRDEGGRPTSFLKTTPCTAVDALPPGSNGRHRLLLDMDVGGPYVLQLTAHGAPGCGPESVVAAGLSPGVNAVLGQDSVVPMFVAPLEAFATVEPPPVEGAESVPRAFHTAVVDSEGSLLVAGGAQDVAALGAGSCARGMTRCLHLSRASSGVHRFDPASGSLVLVGTLDERRFLHSATALGDGRVVYAGGAQVATLGGASSDSDAALVRADPQCTNPNDAAGAGCILNSLEVHRRGQSPALASLLGGRAAHAAVRLGATSLLVAGGRQSVLQRGCVSSAQCAPGATCDVSGRCIAGGRDCTQVIDASTICLPGFSCASSGPDVGKCLKVGCASAADCGGCQEGTSCTGTPSSCDVGTGLCAKRGCSADSECLGSNRICADGNCVQVGCDSLSGCPAGRTCDVDSGKCRPAPDTDCAQGACNCQGDGDCASGYTCQTSGTFAGRCRASQTGCPVTACRRAASEPYFDPDTGELRRDVNCQSGQCVLAGCLGDVDCAAGFLCDDGRCVNGRRVTGATSSAEVCTLGATPSARPCVSVDALATPREGLAAACVSREASGACQAALLWGGNDDPNHLGEVRDMAGAFTSEIQISSCLATASCTPSFSALVEGTDGVVAVGGAAVTIGQTSLYRWLSLGFAVPASAPDSPQIFTAQLSAPRAFATAVSMNGGVGVLGGTGPDLSGNAAGGLFTPAGDGYTQPANLVLGTPRFGHTATVLPDGRIVLIGGIDGRGPSTLSSVEIFTPRSAIR